MLYVWADANYEWAKKKYNKKPQIVTVAHEKLLVLVLTSSSSFSQHTTSQIQLYLTKDGFVEINSIWRPQTRSVSNECQNTKRWMDKWHLEPNHVIGKKSNYSKSSFIKLIPDLDVF